MLQTSACAFTALQGVKSIAQAESIVSKQQRIQPLQRPRTQLPFQSRHLPLQPTQRTQLQLQHPQVIHMIRYQS